MPWHGSDGPLPVRRYHESELTGVARAGLAAFENLGAATVPDANAPGAVGASRLPVNTRDGERISAATAYLPAHRHRPGLTIRSGAEAGRLLTRRSQVTGVRLATGEEIRAARVVLCAGAYGSPALLLRSGIGPAGHLRELGIDVAADLPGVGANLADHPAVSIDLGYHRPVHRAPLFQVIATVRSAAAGPADPPDLHCLAGGPFGGSGAFFLGAALLKPRSRGSVRLRSADPGTPPRIDLGYFREPGDLARLAEGVERVRAAAAETAAVTELSGGVELAPGADVPAGDRGALLGWIRGAAWTYHHPVGTCSMGADPGAGAVVDQGGAVHGIEGLVVADASIMPDIPSANTHLPTIMIAERIASLLACG